jgi:hypothetical protein
VSRSEDLDQELKVLLAETNDQRRVAGQALWHFYRSIVFWRERGRTFLDVARGWAAGGALVFESQAAALRRLGPHARDARLRAFVAEVLAELADDLERGDHLVVPFLRWLEGRFPDLTRMMQEETPDSRIHDHALAADLARALVLLARSGTREEAVRTLREVSASLPG